VFSYVFLRFFASTSHSRAVVPLVVFSIAGIIAGIVGWTLLVRQAKEQYLKAIAALPAAPEGSTEVKP
jgi:hypothetical protein